MSKHPGLECPVLILENSPMHGAFTSVVSGKLPKARNVFIESCFIALNRRQGISFHILISSSPDRVLETIFPWLAASLSPLDSGAATKYVSSIFNCDLDNKSGPPDVFWAEMIAFGTLEIVTGCLDMSCLCP